MIPTLSSWAGRIAAKCFTSVDCTLPHVGKTVYLTFDDGPTPDLTPRLLDLLAQYEARATFFVLGNHAQRYPDLVRRSALEGHVLANHTWTHVDPWLTRSGRMESELQRTTDLIEELTATQVTRVRPPYGRLSPQMMRWARQCGQRVTLWDVMPGDFLPWRRSAGIAVFTVERVRPGSIVVLHDNPLTAGKLPAALELMLRTLAADGWKCEALPCPVPRTGVSGG
jgi:peptidoglycan-N-acetylglucosamine deacetylase